jgi:HK97 family phage portal protein
VQLFGYEVTLSRKAAGPVRPAATGNGWWPIVREPYTGAWQKNDPLTAPIALSNPSVFAVVSRIASDISKIAPPLLLEQDDNGFWTETTNSAYSPVLRRPNRYQTPQQYHERVVLSLLLHGNAYVLKNRDQRGVVDALYLLEPSRVKVLVAPDGAVYYELQNNDLAGIANDTPPVVVPARELIHMRWNCLFHDLMGISPLYAISGAITQAQTIQTSSTTFFGKGGRPAGVLIAPTKLDPLSAQRIKADAANFTTGELLVLENGMKYEPVSTTAVQAQLIEQLGWTEEKICEVFGMPISILNSAKQPPYANAEASQLQYKSECLEVHLTSIANGWTEGLELPTYLKIEFDDTLLIWMDTTTRTNAAKVAITAGMSPNEVRDYYFGLPPVEGGELPYLQQQNWPIQDLANRPPVPAAGLVPPTPPPSEEQVAATVGELAES